MPCYCIHDCVTITFVLLAPACILSSFFLSLIEFLPVFDESYNEFNSSAKFSMFLKFVILSIVEIPHNAVRSVCISSVQHSDCSLLLCHAENSTLALNRLVGRSLTGL